MTEPKRSKLAVAIRIYLEVVWWACIVGIVALLLVLPILMVVIDDVDEPLDMKLLARFQVVAPVAADASGTPETTFPPPIRGQGELRVFNNSRTAWTLQIVGMLVVLGVVLYALWHLRALMRSVLAGTPFLPENASRIRKVGLVVVAWSLLTPFAKYFVGAAMIEGVHVPGILLKPPIEFNPDVLFLGLAIIVLGEIFRQASLLQRDQSLTV
jgi:hypothetical protein